MYSDGHLFLMTYMFKGRMTRERKRERKNLPSVELLLRWLQRAVAGYKARPNTKPCSFMWVLCMAVGTPVIASSQENQRGAGSEGEQLSLELTLWNEGLASQVDILPVWLVPQKMSVPASRVLKWSFWRPVCGSQLSAVAIPLGYCYMIKSLHQKCKPS